MQCSLKPLADEFFFNTSTRKAFLEEEESWHRPTSKAGEPEAAKSTFLHKEKVEGCRGDKEKPTWQHSWLCEKHPSQQGKVGPQTKRGRHGNNPANIFHMSEQTASNE